MILYVTLPNVQSSERYMNKSRQYSSTPIPVSRAIQKLGEDIRDARRRRRIPVALMAERASISRTTLRKIEKGEPGVSIGIYARVIFVLGIIHRLAEVAEPSHDAVGLRIEEEHLPKRIRLRRHRSRSERPVE